MSDSDNELTPTAAEPTPEFAPVEEVSVDPIPAGTAPAPEIEGLDVAPVEIEAASTHSASFSMASDGGIVRETQFRTQ